MRPECTDDSCIFCRPEGRKAIWAVAVFLAVIIVDQIVKIYIKTHFWLGEDHEVFSWFHIRFIENNGMAFGMELGSKIFLTLFRVIAVGLLGWLTVTVIRRRRYPLGLTITLALLTAGAFGNLVDCLFYGEVFSDPYPPKVAEYVGWGEGYSSFGQGRVVDMLYFPLFSFDWPEWMPWIGGKHFSFFDPVFNIADAAVTVSMLILIIFYNKYLGSGKKGKEAREDKKEKA